MAIRRLPNPIQWGAATVYSTGEMFVVSAPVYLDPWPAAALKLTLAARLMDATDQMVSADVTPATPSSQGAGWSDLGQLTIAGLRHPLPDVTTLTAAVSAAIEDAYAEAEEAEKVSDAWIYDLRRTPPAEAE